MDEDVIKVYNQIKELSDNTGNTNTNTNKPTASNIIILVVHLIKCVEKVAFDKSGEYKKNLVMTVLMKVVTDSELDQDAKAVLLETIQTTIPVIIDTMIAIAHDKIDLGKIKESVKSKLYCCC
jgi:hypothetical protein